MNRILLICLATIAVGTTNARAQISHGGEPLNWSDKTVQTNFPVVTTEPVDMNLLQAEDAVTDLYKEAPFRFGVEHNVDLNTENSGEWALYPEQNLAVWRLGVHCPEALSVSFVFSQFEMVKGARLFISSCDREQFIGSFDYHNNNEQLVFATSLIYGDAAVIEYQVPLDSEWGSLHLSQIIHGYRPVLNNELTSANRGPFGNSGACNINVNCPEAEEWQVEKQAVALIVQGGFALCTGSLVNNTAEDGTPYFLTANHCLGNPGIWVFYFNHENDDCSGSTGPTDFSISGSDLKANNGDSDFALVELNDVPPAEWNVQYAGWDNSDLESNVVAATGIHHPSGDVKKICFEEDAPYHDFTDGADVWWIDNWELGVTEGGSSGSPLFNQDHRIIGQLYGGASACAGSVNNGLFDYYGRFGVSWDNGNSSSTRLRDWLDPENTGVTTLDGWPVDFISYNFDAAITNIVGIESTVCGSTVIPEVILRNYGTEVLVSAEIHYQLNGGPENIFNWTGSLAEDQQESVELPELILEDGTNDLLVFVSNPNDAADENIGNNDAEISFQAVTGDSYIVTINVLTDDFPEETSWEISDGGDVIWTSESYADGATLVSSSVCLGVGCYDFTIYDAYGDGICCDWGEGYYNVVNPLGEVIAQGGEFGEEETTEICIETSVAELKGNLKTWIYPNPANEILNIQTTFDSGFELELFDYTGRRVYRNESVMRNAKFSLLSFAPGVYQLKVTSGEGQSIMPVVISR